LKQSPRNSNLGHLERDVSRRRHHLRADLDQLVPQQCHHGVQGVAPGPPISQDISCHFRQSEHLVEFSISQQTGVTGDLGTVEFQLQTTVENDPQSTFFLSPIGFSHFHTLEIEESLWSCGRAMFHYTRFASNIWEIRVYINARVPARCSSPSYKTYSRSADHCQGQRAARSRQKNVLMNQLFVLAVH
jgi:hypothetical protein